MEKEGGGTAFLAHREEGLTLTDGKLEIRGDFTRMLPRLRQGNLERELLVKASGIKKGRRDLPSEESENVTGKDRLPRAVDASAGLGEDSILLAAAGFYVTMYEKDPVIAALLKDALLRAQTIPALSGIVENMELIEGDSIPALRELSFRPDVVLLDPMFPERQKSAAVKKKFQLLHQLEEPCRDEEEFMRAALFSGPQRLIVKRPAKGPFLAGKRPDYSLSGKAVRFDCYINIANIAKESQK